MVVVWGLTLLVCTNAVLFTVRSNYNAGMLLLWLLSAALLVYSLFHRQIDAFCRQGVGFALRCLFWAGAGIFLALFLFVAVSGYANQARNNEKAIIVLGAGVHGEHVSDVLRRRLQAALEAFEQNPAALLVVTGGQGPGENIPEALAMSRWLRERGVPGESIILEETSTSTEENLAYSLPLLEEAGIPPSAPIAVVTNAFHCYRAGRYAGAVGFTSVRTMPASMNLLSVLPSYMREVLAIVYMWVFR